MKLLDLMHFRAQVCAFAMGVLWLLAVSPYLSAQNLIVNGDFEAGNSGFSSQYTYDNTPPMSGWGYYAFGDNPKTGNSLWAAFPDHTPGSGRLMCIADGADVSDKIVWEQTVTVATCWRRFPTGACNMACKANVLKTREFFYWGKNR